MRVLLAAFAAVAVLAGGIFYVSVVSPMFAKAYSGEGAGSITDPYQIATCAQLQEIADNLTAQFVLIQDVDCSATLTENNFQPISNFSGVLDGRNYAIKDLFINRPSENNAGLFTDTTAIIKNLRLTKEQTPDFYDSIIGGNNVGAVATELKGGASLLNVQSELNVKAVGFDTNIDDNQGPAINIGGIVAVNLGVIDQASSTGWVKVDTGNAENVRLGGLIGFSMGRTENSFSTGSVSLTTSRETISGNCGGFMGLAESSSRVVQSYATSSVDCPQAGITTGGFVGAQNGTEDPSARFVIDSFATGAVNGSQAGGFAGNVGSDNFEEVYYDVTSTGQAECWPQGYGGCTKINADGNNANYFIGNADSRPISVFKIDEKWLIVPDALPTFKPLAVSPDAPVNITAIRSNGAIDLSWEAPAENDGRNTDIDGYIFEVRSSSSNDMPNSWTTINEGAPVNALTYHFEDGANLNRLSYEFRIRTHNTTGTSNVPSGRIAVPVDVPTTAPSLTVVRSTARRAEFTIGDVANALSYVLQYKKATDSEWGDLKTIDWQQIGDTVPVVALDQQTAYDFRVAAQNGGGQGPWSSTVNVTTASVQNVSITNCQELQNMSENLEASYTLANDIDCTDTVTWNEGKGFLPIGANQDGHATDIFTGVFNGAGHSITGLYINQSFVIADENQTENVGLFGRVGYADIQNVTLVNPQITVTHELDPTVDQDANGLPDWGDDALVSTTNATGASLSVIHNFPNVFAGAVAGSSSGSLTLKNVTVSNAVVSGAISGGLLGSVADAYGTNAGENILIAFGQGQNGRGSLIDTINVSGYISGTMTGGVVGYAPVIGFEARVVITNVSSTAEVQGNMSGGVLGIGLAVNSLVPGAGNDLAFSDAVITALGGQQDLTGKVITLSNVTSSGLVSTCEVTSGIRIGSLGGVVGIGVGLSMSNVKATGAITSCTNTDDDLGQYGGSYGGIGGSLISSSLKNSSATGDITIFNDHSNEQSGGGVLAAMGGISGIMAVMSDQNGQPAVDTVTASGNLLAEGDDGLANIIGGMFGAYVGGGTITNSHASGTIRNATGDGNVAALSIAGGFNGLTFGLDARFVTSSILSILSGGALDDSPTKGLVVKDCYATGSVTTDRTRGIGGLIAINGGFGGLAVGEIDFQSVYATGNVLKEGPTNALIYTGAEGDPQDSDTAFSTIAQNDATAHITGGLFGMTAGMDITNAMQGFFDGEDDPNNGLYIFNSYATGKVEGLISGGLIGAAELRTTVNKSYATGSVDGTFAGGLVGETGLASTIGVSALANIVLADYTNELPDQVLNGIRQSINSLTPVQINNTYATGAVKGHEFDVRLTGLVFENPNTTPARIPAVIGGIVGLQAGSGMKLGSSYASGALSVATVDEQPIDTSTVRLPELPSFAGGIAGMVLAVPKADGEKIREFSTPDTELQAADMFPEPTTIDGVFSVSPITLNERVVTGGAFGVFLSPVGTAFQGEVPQDVFYSVSDIYYDRAKIDTSACDGFTNPSDRVQTLWDQFLSRNDRTTLETYYENHSLADDPTMLSLDTLYEGPGDTYDPAYTSISCTTVNANNSNPKYFIANDANSPMNTWDFNAIWKVRKDDYPKFVAGAQDPDGPDDPGNPPTPGSTTSTNTTNTPNTDISTSPDVTEIIQRLAQRGAAGRTVEQVKGLKAILARVPVFLAKSIPFSLILLLLILAAMYSYQAQREYHQLKIYHNNIRRIIATKESVDNYLAITTHYLNTPVAIMSGAVELLESLKKITGPRAASIRAKIKRFSDDAAGLLSANQVSNAQSANDERLIRHDQPNPLKAKAVWVPAVIALGLLVMANALFVYADVFNRSPYRMGVELALYALGVFLIALAYRYRNFMAVSKEVVKKQLAMESQLYQRREAFLPEAAQIVGKHYDDLQAAAEPLAKVAEAKLLMNGLDMLGGISEGLQKVQRFANFEAEAPLFDVSTYVQKAVQAHSAEAATRHITVEAKVSSGLVGYIQPEAAKQLVDSLVDNAVKFSKDGGHVEVSAYKRFNKLVISVSDNGVGISSSKLPSLLKPFSRGTDSMQYNYEGLGLGLYTDKVITDRLGGTLEIRSKLGEGTVATITVPFQHEANALVPILVTPEASA